MPAHAAALGEMRAELFVELPVLAFGEEMQIERPEDWPEAIRIVLRPFVAVVRGELEHVAKALLRRPRASPQKIRPDEPASPDNVASGVAALRGRSRTAHPGRKTRTTSCSPA